MPIFITLSNHNPDFDYSVNGAAISANEEQLDEMAKEVGVHSFLDFFSQPQDEAIELIEEAGGDPSKMTIPEEEWFEPSEGLLTLRELRIALAKDHDGIAGIDKLLKEFDDFERVLKLALERGMKWHSSVDY